MARLMLGLFELGTACHWPGEMVRVAINEAIGIDTRSGLEFAQPVDRSVNPPRGPVGTSSFRHTACHDSAVSMRPPGGSVSSA